MELVSLKSAVRETGNRMHRSTVRAAGNVPAVIYGDNQDALPITVNEKIVEKLLRTEGGVHAVVQLEFDDTQEYNSPALIKAVQWHPVKDTLLHVDFLRIRLDQRIQTQVSIVLKGRAKGIIEGGVIDNQIREVDIECLALEVPECIEVDISELGLGESVHVGDLSVAEGVTILTKPDFAIASIHMPRVVKSAEEEEAEAEEAAAAAAEEEATESAED